MDYHSHLSEPSGFRTHTSPTPVVMWPSGRFQPWVLIAFQTHIIFSKYILEFVPSPFSIQLKTINKGTQHVSSQPLLIIHVFHTRWSIHQICILQFFIHTINIKDLISKFESTQQDRVSKNQNDMVGNFNQNHISRWDSALLCFSLGHQS